MRKYYKKLTLVSLLSVVVFVVTTHLANAQGGSVIESVTSFFGLGLSGIISYTLAALMNALLMVASYILALSGLLLNLSIVLTLRIKDFVDSAPAIYTTWKALRDISGLFIIFFLLYSSIQLILGVKKPNWGEQIKNIVMAGILINFSFFFAGLGIDASNIISIQLYNAIAPANTTTLSGAQKNSISEITSTWGDGGISDIFMNSLQIPTLYKTTGNQTNSLFGSSDASRTLADKTVFDNLKIVMIGITGIMIEIVAAISFAVAAFAFIFRFVMLLFLLAFSPIWFLSFLPEVKTYTEDWIKKYKQMLIFMPVYLLLLYLAMNVLTTTPLFKNLNAPTTPVTVTGNNSPTGSIIENVYAGNTPAGGAGSHWYDEFMVLAVNATLVVFLLNLPLVAAASIAGKSVPLLDNAVKNFGAGKISGWAGGWVGTRTLGAGASKIDKALSNTRLGNSLLARDIRSVTTGALAKNSLGYSRSYDDRNKELKEVGKKGQEISRVSSLKSALNRQKSNTSHPIDPITKKEMNPNFFIGKMGEKEKLAVIGMNLKDDAKTTDIIKSFRGSDFEAIKKSDDLTDENKARISELRKEALSDAINKNQTDYVKNMVENMDGKDLLKLPDNILRSQEVVEHLKPSQLKTMADEGISDQTKRNIGGSIDNWTTPHRAMGYIRKNSTEWL